MALFLIKRVHHTNLVVYYIYHRPNVIDNGVGATGSAVLASGKQKAFSQVTGCVRSAGVCCDRRNTKRNQLCVILNA